MNIKVEVKESYGIKRIYILDNAQNKAIQKLTGAKTLTDNHIKGLKELGFKFEVLAQQI